VLVVDDRNLKESMNEGRGRGAKMVGGVNPGGFGFPGVEEGAEAEGEVA
jgi:hypothetical protein